LLRWRLRARGPLAEGGTENGDFWVISWENGGKMVGNSNDTLKTTCEDVFFFRMGFFRAFGWGFIVERICRDAIIGSNGQKYGIRPMILGV